MAGVLNTASGPDSAHGTVLPGPLVVQLATESWGVWSWKHGLLQNSGALNLMDIVSGSREVSKGCADTAPACPAAAHSWDSVWWIQVCCLLLDPWICAAACSWMYAAACPRFMPLSNP